MTPVQDGERRRETEGRPSAPPPPPSRGPGLLGGEGSRPPTGNPHLWQLHDELSAAAAQPSLSGAPHGELDALGCYL